ncbi:membrane protein [Acrocarpospora phusangensis]|uniref:Membrane protein n=2 Tax=Acrocarpospora phusangensis TaxID=1070424 RepID=A0A919Q9N7_9ACTN|nr:membrane protein [Acrocarpospora phusangensis]
MNREVPGRHDRRMTKTTKKRREWLAPAGLLVLSAVPVAAGAFRLTQLTGGAAVTAENARFFASPIPVALHIVGATLYCVLGAFQFVPGFRRRRSGWHRAAGRLLIPCGLIAALSGLWMTLFYPRPPGDGDLLAAFRLLFGTAMVACILLGLAAIRRRDITRHRAWMIRGYAIGQGAGTQAVTQLPLILLAGAPIETTRALLLAAAWVINLAVAEWIIRRPRTRVRS